ncbi:MAG: HAD family hydrolase [Acetobacter sp.]|nr:HAD family hydrolase [Bacteroides sp.]MCM1340245.1 HAD family hydrolase [Acetobacter sp.]MCM1432803.1 HAD family hydrolase [Clostridiales bacterium]
MEKTFENWLVVSDIDGTLNNKFRKLPKRNYDAIKKFTECGGNFTLASGRLQSSLERNYNRITPNQPAVILNGAGIYDYNKRKMLWQNTIGPKGRDFVRYISKEFDDIFKRVDIGIYFADYVYIVKSGLFSKGTMYFDKAKHEYVKSIDDVPEEGWMKVIFWSNPLVINKLQKLVESMENPDANFMSSSLFSYEMLQKDTHKGVGIMKLADILGIEKSHVAAIGDYYNDWDMLKTVGLPACAGQAPSAIHNICKFEACHCNNGCVADLLEYIMSGKADEDIANGIIKQG